MENSQALKWAAIYFGLWLLAGVLGLVVIAAGLALGGLGIAGYGTYVAYTPSVLRIRYIPIAGAALMVVGLLVWKYASAAAFFKTVTTAVETETTRRLNTETMKSDILSVLDDRLSDMHQEVTRTRRLVNRQSRDDAASEFEFGED